MSHLIPHGSTTIMNVPAPSDVLTPTQAPVGGTQAKGSQTPSFLGSSVLPPQGGVAGGAPGNEKKLLGQ